MNDRFHILIYHQVLDRRDPLRPYEVDKRAFRRQIQLLARIGNVVTLDEAVRRSPENSLSRGTVCITFDDGYADNFRNGMPILREFGVPATVFVAAGFTDGQSQWVAWTILEFGRRPGPIIFETGGWGAR